MTKVTVAFHSSAYTPNNTMPYYMSAVPDKTQNSAFLQKVTVYETVKKFPAP